MSASEASPSDWCNCEDDGTPIRTLLDSLRNDPTLAPCMPLCAMLMLTSPVEHCASAFSELKGLSSAGASSPMCACVMVGTLLGCPLVQAALPDARMCLRVLDWPHLDLLGWVWACTCMVCELGCQLRRML